MKKLRIVLLVIIVLNIVLFASDTNQILAYFLKIKGNVRVQKNNKWVDVKRGDRILNGNVIKVDKKGLAIIKFIDKGDIIAIKENSTIKIQGKINNGKIEKRLFLKVGDIMAIVKKGSSGGFDINTPTATASIKGTEFDSSFKNDTTFLSAYKGVISLFNNEGEILVNKGENAICTRGSAPKLVKKRLMRTNKLVIEILDKRNKRKTIELNYEEK